ncbi:MAG: hypothetical protein AUK33_05035 [Flavobacteriaceae bacterium CG2_30_34_30]|nr:MAG: hypothetical protein AUK33_05035 [Flavobacteriaceae bacterium CG2_30_34_30]
MVKIGKAVSIMGGGQTVLVFNKKWYSLRLQFFPRGRLARSLKQPTGMFFNAPPCIFSPVAL